MWKSMEEFQNFLIDIYILIIYILDYLWGEGKAIWALVRVYPGTSLSEIAADYLTSKNSSSEHKMFYYFLH